MNKVELKRYIEKLKYEKIDELRTIKNKELMTLKNKLAIDYYNDNKVFFTQLIELSKLKPNELRQEGLETVPTFNDLLRILSGLNKCENEESIIQFLIEHIRTTYVWNETRPVAELKYNKAIEKVNTEFHKLQGNLKNLNGKDGTAYCLELGIPIKSETVAHKNEVLAPIDVNFIKSINKES